MRLKISLYNLCVIKTVDVDTQKMKSMLRISGNADKSVVIAALQAYCQPLIYDYDKRIRVDEDENHYHINSFTIGIPAFCNFIYDTLSEKTKAGKHPLNVVIINVSTLLFSLEDMGILEDCAITCQNNGYAGQMILITK